MSEKRDIAGLWWLSSKPDERWTGTLTLEPDKSPKLVVDVPKSIFESIGQKLTTPPTIHGCDQNGNPITLLTPSPPRTQGGRALSKITYSAHYSILGLELLNHSDFKVNELTFRIQQLQNWIGLTGFSSMEMRDNGLSIHFDLPKDESFTINNELSIKFCQTFAFKNDRHAKNLEENVGVTFVSKNGISLPTLKHFLHAFRSLLHFAALKRIYPLEIKARKDGHGYGTDGNFHPTNIEIWNSIIKEETESELQSDRWIFQFIDVHSRFSEFFSSWLRFY
jgi:hypothetical protein